MRGKITRGSSIAVVTHELFYGASQALRDYLNSIPVASLAFISHPINRQNPLSYTQVFHKGKLMKQKNFSPPGLPTIGEYIIHELVTFLWIFQRKKKYDVFIGVNPLNCFAGIICKKLGWSKHIIFYAIDFTPKRFDNMILNTFYHRLEAFCVYHADECWNVSPRIAQGREKFLGLSDRHMHQKVVPIGVWQRDIVKVNRGVREKHEIIFVGHILKKQGIQMVVKALPRIAEKIPDVTLRIIGDGEYRPSLESLVRELHMTKRVIFHGLEHNQGTIKSMLLNASLAVACYDPTGEGNSNFTFYADPTKIKTYLASGLPVILTSIPYNASEIQRRKCGVVVSYDEESIGNAITELLAKPAKLHFYKRNAVAYIQAYTWERIFPTAFNAS